MPPVGQAMEFLSKVLSERGPQAVPYAENTKWAIREHMSELLKVRSGVGGWGGGVGRWRWGRGRRVVRSAARAHAALRCRRSSSSCCCCAATAL